MAQMTGRVVVFLRVARVGLRGPVDNNLSRLYLVDLGSNPKP